MLPEGKIPSSVGDDQLQSLVTDLSESATQGGQTQDQSPEDSIPEKYRGKSVHDLIEMHRNAERELGRLGHQLGEQRELVNVLAEKIATKRSRDLGEDDPPQDYKLTPEALLDNPTEALEKFIKSRMPKAGRDDDDRVRRLEQQLQLQRLTTKHPDYLEVSNSEDFVEFVKASPTRLITARQGAAGDVDAAIAILDEYKAHVKARAKDTPKVETDAARVQLERSSAASSEPGQGSRRKYSRRALLALQERNPEKYKELLPHIRAAYARGDVIDDL